MDEVTRELRAYRDDYAAFDEVGVDYTDPASWTAEEWERIDQINHTYQEEHTRAPPTDDIVAAFDWYDGDTDPIPF